MELTVEQSTLTRALRLVARVVPARSINPVHQLVLLDAEPGLLRLTATDGDLGAIVTVPADIAASGQVGIPARLLSDYVAQLPSGPIRIGADPAARRVRVCSGHFASDFALLGVDGFPVLPAADDSSGLELDAARLRGAIDRVAFAAARGDQRPVLAGVLFDLTSDGLILAAADGFRLARTQLPEVTSSPRQLIIPARALAEFARVLDASVETARLTPTTDGGGVYLKAKDTAFFARLVQGPFPEIERVIPKGWRTRVTLETGELRKGVRVAGFFGDVGAHPVVLRAEESRLMLEAQDDETGQWRSELPASLEGEAQAVALNALLLAEVLDAVRTSVVELAWNSPQEPVVVREAGHTTEADLWAIMPLYLASLSHPRSAAAAGPGDDDGHRGHAA